MSKVIDISQDQFGQIVLKSSVPTLVDFYADYCGPCRLLKSSLDALAEMLDGSVRIVAIDVVANLTLAQQLGISTVPTLIVYRDGKEVQRMHGLTSTQTLQAALQNR